MIRKAKHHIIVIVNIVNTETDSSNVSICLKVPVMLYELEQVATVTTLAIALLT